MLADKYEYELAIVSRATAWSSTASDFFVCNFGSNPVVCHSYQYSEGLISSTYYLGIKSLDMDTNLPAMLRQVIRRVLPVADG